MNWGPDRWRLYGLALSELGRACRSLPRRLTVPSRFLGPSTQRVLIAPQDLRTSDPTVASDIYAGVFVFAGRSVSTGGRSPFDFAPPSRAWSEALLGFGWLRHLRAADTALARANARALVNDFITRRRDHHEVVRRTPVVARRLLSFLIQSPLLLEGADHGFYRRFLRNLVQMIRELDRDMRCARQPLHRLQAAIGLCYAGLCCGGLDNVLRRATRVLARELEHQVLADGGHRGRNPSVGLELLLDLLPLRQTYASRGLEPPEALVRAIERMLPFLRLLRHGDGTLAHFNGMGTTAADHLATLLMYEGGRGKAMRRAPHAGYERLEAGSTVLTADVGPPPRVEDAADAHAGCLSFELSSGAYRIVVNCGAARLGNDETRLAARSTAAHTTAGVGGVSCGRFLERKGWWAERAILGWLVRRLDNAMFAGPTAVAVAREDQQDRRAQPQPGLELRASHDGYRRLGITHERRWRLSAAGDRLEGEDRFTPAGRGRKADAVTIRFHLFPGVKATRLQSGRAIMLVLPNREAWQFHFDEAEGNLEESVFFAGNVGMRRCEQIVVALKVSETPVLHWRMERLGAASERATAGTQVATPPLL